MLSFILILEYTNIISFNIYNHFIMLVLSQLYIVGEETESWGSEVTPRITQIARQNSFKTEG